MYMDAVKVCVHTQCVQVGQKSHFIQSVNVASSVAVQYLSCDSHNNIRTICSKCSLIPSHPNFFSFQQAKKKLGWLGTRLLKVTFAFEFHSEL